jgi:pilus assembly protein CpaB
MARTLPRPWTTDRQNRVVLYGAVGLAALAAVLAFVALRGASGDDTSGALIGDTDVVVTTRAVAAGETVNLDMLEVATLPSEAVVANPLASLEGLTDGMVARHALAEGEQITSAKLGTKGDSEGGFLPALVPPGLRAVSIAVTEEKVFSGLLAPGDRVDVIAIVEDLVDEAELPRAVLLVQNAEVGAVADVVLESVASGDIDGNPIAGPESLGTRSERPADIDAEPDAKSVTLFVTPEDSLLIALAQEQWSVWLSVRGEGDDEIVNVPPRLLDFTP